MEEIVKIKSIESITHDVLRIVTEKPASIRFTPGQAIEMSIHKIDWQTEKRPFTFTSLPGNDYLEFTIKVYAAHQGVTAQLRQLKKDDKLILFDVFGTISYQGKGLFIAGGAGITPFISIFRDLAFKKEIAGNKLLFANKTRADIIHEEEFRNRLGKNFINILSHEKADGYANGMITEDLIKFHLEDFQNVYLCGPPPMMESVEGMLADLKVDGKFIVKESF